MAHKKGVGSSDNGRDSNSKRLGVKLFGGQAATAGNIIIRQRGTKFHPGSNVGMGRDHTLYALIDGEIKFTTKRRNRTFVSVIPNLVEVKESLDTPVAKPKAEKKSAPKADKKESAEVKAESTPKAEVKAEPKEEKKASPKAEKKEETKAAKKKATPKAEKKEEPKADKKKAPATGKGDNLKVIDGIGPKIAEILSEAGLGTYSAIADSSPEKIAEVLSEAGNRYKSHDPALWPEQAKIAATGDLDKLKEWQESQKEDK